MAAPNMDQFEAYFRRADLDGDGKISGAEAVNFFEGSALPKPVLAQIWNHANQAKTGFLGRNEFYNALRLVTVAQSKRDLTPEIVNAALYGPAAAQIPAPQINLAAIPPQHPSQVASTSVANMNVTAPTSTQSFAYRGGQGLAGSAVNPQYFPPQQSLTMMRPPQSMPAGTAPRPFQSMPAGSAPRPFQSMPAGSAPHPPQSMPAGSVPRPPQSMPAATAPHPQQGIAGPDISRGINMAGHNLLNPSISNDWNSGGIGTVPSRPAGITQSVALATPTSPSPVSPMFQPITTNTKSSAVSGNGYSSNSILGNNFFSAASSTPKQEPNRQNYSVSSTPASSAIVPVSGGAQPLSKHSSLDSLQGAFSMQLTNNSQISRTQSAPNTSQQIPPAASSPLTASGISVGLGNTSSDNSQPTWPKMKPSDVKKYTNVFIEMDSDRDGKITGEQARSLFFSWRLPIDVLQKVLNLSDQDNDGMLSLKEFCFALYLMERYREGRPLPQSLPSNVLFDETLLSMTGHQRIAYGNAAWGVGPGFQQQQGMPGARPVAPGAGLRPPVQGTPARADGTVLPDQKKSGTPVLQDSFFNDTDNSEQNILNSKPHEAATAGKKAEETQNVYLDSKEKIAFYRDKMQELVLYKSRCDNRLNEITERASADKREAELLGKKYEEKYKQVAEIASKLTVEEAKFRDIQERKEELQQAIVKMEQGGSADGILQVRADRIQSDLEELFRALAERCKKHGIDVKSVAMVQLPDGWQPGITEGAAVWDEDWDKFEDEGFANDFTFAKNASPKSKPTFIPGEKTFSDDNSVNGSPVNANGKQDISTVGDYTVEDESYAHSEDDLARSPRERSAGRTTVESPSQDYSNAHFAKSPEADAESRRSFDESTWGAFDNNDDVDSVWGFNTAKGSDLEQQRDFFKSDDFGINPVRTGSSHTDGTFQTKSAFAFDDSVPGTPLSKFGNSPRYSEAGDHFFDTSRFDSFSMHESGSFPQPDRLTRFDSISSSKDFGYNNDKFTRVDSMNSSKDFGYNNEKFTRVDSMSSSKDFGYNNEKFTRFDSISSSRDFGYNPERLTRFDSMSSSKDFGFGNQGHTRFDSISSTKDFGYSAPFTFDDSDPFGSSGPFKVSSDNQSPKKGSDNWNQSPKKGSDNWSAF